jgi:CheY-like chemotaxis protein
MPPVFATVGAPEDGNGNGNGHAAASPGLLPNAIKGPTGAAAALAERMDNSVVEQGVVADDRDALEQGDRVLLIIEDDPDFASIVLDGARERGFKGVIALRGDSGLALAHRLAPDAIVLDVELPGADGLDVLGHLKRHPDTRHIPVHVLSGHDEHRRDAMRAGAVAYLDKPITREALGVSLSEIRAFVDRDVSSVLLVEDDDTARATIGELIGGGDGDVDVVGVATAEEALAALEVHSFDCVVLDLNLADEGGSGGPATGESGFALLERLQADGGSPSCRSSSTRARRSPGSRTPGCGATRRRSSSRTSTRPSGSWTRPRSSCTASRRACPWRSGACSSNFTIRMPPSPGSGSSSWTTTCATCSRSPTRSRSAGWRSSSPRTAATA